MTSVSTQFHTATNAVVNQSHRDRTIDTIPILTITALEWCYICTNAIVIWPPSLSLTDTDPLNMTVISDDPSLWPLIHFNIAFGYFIVAAFTVVVYDWALSFGQEFELVWRQRWSFMTILYLSLRTAGIIYIVVYLLSSLPSISVTDAGCTTLALSVTWLTFIINTILDIIIVARLHAMYQQSGKMLVFLVAIFLAITISCGVITAMVERNHFSYEEYILSGTYQCIGDGVGNDQLLLAATWILGSVWEVLALSLAIWITVKRSRDLRQWKIEDRFLALMKTQVLYFAAFIVTTCLILGAIFSPAISTSTSVGVEVYSGALSTLQFVQMFMLGPRLILSVREYNAKLVANPDTDIGLQLLSRSAHTTSQVAVVYGSGGDQRVFGTLQRR